MSPIRSAALDYKLKELHISPNKVTIAISHAYAMPSAHLSIPIIHLTISLYF